jgi:hypothetical protein
VKGRGLAVAVALLAVACRQRQAPAPGLASLGEGRAARVGAVSIPSRLVASVAGARLVGARDAVDDLVDDALLSEGAKAQGLDRSAAASWACDSAAARWETSRVLDEARQQGAPKDDELATVEVMHAIVLRSALLAPSRGEALAEQIRQMVAGAGTIDERAFDAAARRVPHPGAQVTIERLPPFDASGRSDDGVTYDAAFVTGAFALTHPGETSPVVASPFGWHVIRLIARSVPKGEVLAERRRDLAGAVIDMRARQELRDALVDARRRVRVEVLPQADAFTADAARIR